jgi:hypothetical protein
VVLTRNGEMQGYDCRDIEYADYCRKIRMKCRLRVDNDVDAQRAMRPRGRCWDARIVFERLPGAVFTKF